MELAILKQLQSLTDVEKKQKEHHVFSDDIRQPRLTCGNQKRLTSRF